MASWSFDSRLFLSAVLFFFLALTACEHASKTDAGVTRRDSSGVEIVENARPEWTTTGSGWRLSDAARVTIGDLEGAEEYLLDRVTGAVRMRDGRIIVANSGSAELRVFDATGRFVRSVGRRGWGPGEFQRLNHLLRLAGDTIAVWDAGIGPISYFDSELSFIRRETIERSSLLDVLGPKRATEAVTPLTDGSFVLHVTLRETSEMTNPPGVVFRPSLGFFRYNRDFSRVDSLGWYGGLPQMYLRLGGRNVHATRLVPTHAVATAGGTPLVTYAGNGEPYEISAFDAKGQLTRIIRRTDPPIPLPHDAEQRFGMVSPSMGSRGMQEFNRVRAAMPRQTHYPAYQRIYSDPDGYLWVSSLGDGMHVFDTTGRWLGGIAVPGRPLEIGRDYMLVLTRDSLHVERVQLFDLRRQ